MPAPIVLRNLTPETVRVANPPAGEPEIATRSDWRDGSRTSPSEPPPPASGTDPVQINLAENSIDPNSWQATLGAEFDIVETFDFVQDWHGQFGDAVAPSTLPKLTDGSDSMWGRRTNDRITVAVTSNAGFSAAMNGGETVTFSGGASGTLWKSFTEGGQDYLQFDVGGFSEVTPGETATGNTSGATTTIEFLPAWIRDHGARNTFRSGKSACINYNDFSNGIDGFGPSRLEMFFGNGETGKSGYQKVHLFFMMKFGENFFNQGGDGSFSDVGTIKILEIETGFTAVDFYGTPEEQLTVEDNAQKRRDYGCNLMFITMQGGGLSLPNSLFFREDRRTAREYSGGWGYEQVSGHPRRMGGSPGSSGDIAADYIAERWMGVELILDTGTVDVADGAGLEMYIYDENGTELHHVPPDPNKVVVKHFDHRFNKIVFGGNRLCNGYGSCPEGQNSRYYIDDVIVHGNRIAPTYFQKLAERV